MLFFLLCDGGISMEIFTMECFLNAADLKSLSKAAVKMCITQPALSMQIKKLEAELNVKLINRSSHSFALTEEGRAAYQSFTSIVGAYKDLKWQLDQDRNSQKILRVGYHGPTTWANIPDLFCAFMLDHPHIQIDATVSELGKLVDMVTRGDIDVAILVSPDMPSFEIDNMITVALFRELGCFGMSPEHPLAERSIIHTEDLDGYRIYMNSGGQIMERTRHFVDAGLEPMNIHFANGYIATIANALAKNALVILPRSFKLNRDNIVYVDHDIDELAVSYYAVCRKDNMSRENRLFLDACKNFSWPGMKKNNNQGT